MLGSIFGCSLIVGEDGAVFPSAPATLTLSPELVRFGDTVTAIADGSVDPAGRTVTYRFEWLRGSTVVRTETHDLQDALEGEFLKGDSWTVRVTPVSADEREGVSIERTFVVVNTAPTVETVGLSTYRPIADDLIRAQVVGYHDADGDPDTSRYVWTLGERPPIETQVGELDLSDRTALSEPPNEATEKLTLEVIPSDGEADNPEAIVRVGPLDLVEDVTQWRKLSPWDRVGLFGLNSFVMWDSKHRRFVFHGAGELWEYTTSLGYVRLHPDGAPSIFLSSAVYDATPGAERILVVGTQSIPAGRYVLNLWALDVHSRGSERWTKIPVEDFPLKPLTFRCFPGTYFEHESRVLLIYGGWEDSCPGGTQPINDVLALDLSDPERGTWLKDSPLPTVIPAAGVTLVKHPSLDDHLLVLGGTDDVGDGVPIQVLEYDFSDLDDVRTWRHQPTGDAFIGSPVGVLAIPDPARNTVVGGLGARLGNLSQTVRNIWAYDVAASPVYDGLFKELDTSLGASFGVGGWDGDRILFWPGMDEELAMTFRLGQVEPLPEGGYLWSSLLRSGFDVPKVVSQAVSNGTRAIITTGDTVGDPEERPVFEYDFATHTWTPSLPGSGPGNRIEIRGGKDRNGSLWTIGGEQVDGGDANMTPWRFRSGAWEELPVGGPLPAARKNHVIFETGCGETAPVGVFGGTSGGLATDETWILRCPAGTSSCTWDSLGGGTPGPLVNAAAAFDGTKYVVLFGGLSGSTVSGEVHVLDVCDSPDDGWQPATLEDPEEGAPSLHRHEMIYLPDKGAPEFLVMGGQPAASSGDNRDAWRLRETGDKRYAWSLIGSGAPALLDANAVWDGDQGRVVVFSTGALLQSNAVWELRLRD